MVADIFDAWLNHWGWLWMLVGLCGWIGIVVSSD